MLLGSKNDSNDASEPIKRRRGRPPKTQKTDKETTSKKKKTKIDFEEEIILQLPRKLLEKKESPESEKNAFTTVKEEVQDEDIFTITNISSQSSDDNSNDGFHDDTKKSLINKLKERDNQIHELMEEVARLKKRINNSIDTTTNKIKKMTSQVSGYKGQSMDTKDVDCLWCGYHIGKEDYTFHLPMDFHNKQYLVDGCFHTPGCALAYNISLDDYKVSHRESLFAKLYDIDLTKISIAPARKAFKNYGGIVSQDFDAKMDIKKTYLCLSHPLTGITSMVEERYNEAEKHMNLNPVDPDEYVLKRTKPLPNKKKTVFETMGIEVKKK